MKLAPIIKETAEAKATRLLRNFITSGAVTPGTRITETHLSEEMNISRATVRSVLNSLSGEGLITLIPYTGWMITELSAQDIWELYTLRSAYERLGSRLAAKFINENNHREILQKAYKEFVQICQEGSPDEVAESDLNLHHAIIDISMNKSLQEQNLLISRKVMLFIKSSNALINTSEEILSQHTPIIEAILDGDMDKAGQLSEEHNLSEGEKLFTYMMEKERQL